MERLREIRDAGGDLLVVGLGPAESARALRADTGYAGTLLVDEDGAAYRAASLRRTGLLGHLRPSVLLGYLRAKKEGHHAGKLTADPWQQGGTLVIAPPGRVTYAWRDRVGTKPAPYAEVLAAVRACAG